MKNSLDKPEKENQNSQTAMADENERLLTKLYETDERTNAPNGIASESGLEFKWQIKEKLFLVSFVLLNGDSNWTYVSEQLNKWIDSISTSNFKSLSHKRTFSVSVFVCFWRKCFTLRLVRL